MAERPHQFQGHPQHQGFNGGIKPLLHQRGPPASKVLAALTLLPVGGSLLGLSGVTLIGTLMGLVVTGPLFIIFSPILVPAAVVLGLSVAAILTSGVFGLTALSSLSWGVKYVRGDKRPPQMDLEYAKKRMQDMAGHVGQKTKEVGQTIQSKAQEGGRT